ncbi:hypothetical protein FXO38_31516 [Capsicum annuum]|nr:hypothetical protein FXO38_31516 [Capsicum annuum]
MVNVCLILGLLLLFLSVDPCILGRITNVIGETIDERGPITTDHFLPIHYEAPAFVEQASEQQILVTGIKHMVGLLDSTGPNADKAKEQFKILKYVIGAFMLRRTKSQLIESGILVLPPLTEITVLYSLSSLLT